MLTPYLHQWTDNKEKISQGNLALIEKLDQIIYTYIYTYIYVCVCVCVYLSVHIHITFHSNTAIYTFFSSACGTFSRIHLMLGHKTSLNKFKKIEITSRIFYDHDGMTLEID